MGTLVRKYEDLDFEQVNLLIKNSFGYERKNISDSSVYEFVCLDDDIVVGYFNMTITHDIIKDIRIAHIDYVCVNEEFRGRGYGKKMMEYALDFCVNNDVGRVELTSSSKRVAAHRLYLSLGFEIRDSSIFRKELL